MTEKFEVIMHSTSPVILPTIEDQKKQIYSRVLFVELLLQSEKWVDFNQKLIDFAGQLSVQVRIGELDIGKKKSNGCNHWKTNDCTRPAGCSEERNRTEQSMCKGRVYLNSGSRRIQSKGRPK